MLIPNLDCWVTKQTPGAANLYGEMQLASPVRERCAVVKLRGEVQHSTVRADSSASRGHAEEFVTSNKILLMSTTTARQNDKLLVAGVTMRIITLMPRFDVVGRLDHYEVSGEIWE